MVYKNLKTNSGFTLIEVLISITLLSILMSYVYNIIDNSVNTKDTITQEDRALLGIERALDRIATDFTQVYSPLYFSPIKKDYSSEDKKNDDLDKKVNEFETSEKFPLLSHNGLPVPAFESPDKSTFIFLSTANRRRIENTKEARFVWVRYKLISDEKSRGGSTLIRNFIATDIYSPDNDFSKADDQVILRNIKNLSFEFWDPVKKRWASGLREIGNAKYTIALIRIKMEWLDVNDNIIEFSRTFRQYWQTYDPYLDELIYKEEQEAIEKVEKSKQGASN